MVWAVQHFQPYLYGHRCRVYTNHEALKSLLNTPHPSWKLAHWGFTIQELKLEIHYRPGRSNHATDALSCQVNNVTTGDVVQTVDGDGTVHRLTPGNSEELGRCRVEDDNTVFVD